MTFVLFPNNEELGSVLGEQTGETRLAADVKHVSCPLTLLVTYDWKKKEKTGQIEAVGFFPERRTLLPCSWD